MTRNEHHDNAAHLARLLKVIADETRLRILGLLGEREHNGKEIGERLELTPPTISHHMRKLVEAGIVTATPDAQQQIYALNNQLLLDARAKPIAVPAARLVATEGDADRARVLANFFEGPRLKSIPARRKQRVIVLQHLLERFDPARTYSEPEVNDLLRVAHDDVATLRRELVDYGYMERERGIYQVSRHPPARSKQVAQEITGDEIAWLRGLITSSIAPQPASPDAEDTVDI
ncbi:MAG TPA: metalloregulator ArsR/SmtB family transcription factor [Thermomicrobiales bacterium]|nr:metalloregulator ArsR/SmtB family transcription factor [Thermomicrobiales bacterium]